MRNYHQFSVVEQKKNESCVARRGPDAYFLCYKLELSLSCLFFPSWSIVLGRGGTKRRGSQR